MESTHRSPELILNSDKAQLMNYTLKLPNIVKILHSHPEENSHFKK
jgi:hypothetical protein